MVKKILDMYKKYEEIINYLVVGVATTVFTWIIKAILVYFIFDVSVVWQNTVVTALADACGIVFAYFTNRKYVFKSTDPHMMKEFLSFAAGRVGTTVFDIVAMDVLVLVFGEKLYLVYMILISVLVVVANYVLSKFFVFKDDKKERES
jgi:putative flippase GtrA